MKYSNHNPIHDSLRSRCDEGFPRFQIRDETFCVPFGEGRRTPYTSSSDRSVLYVRKMLQKQDELGGRGDVLPSPTRRAAFRLVSSTPLAVSGMSVRPVCHMQ